MRKEWLAVGVLVVILVMTVVQLASALGRARLLEEQLDIARDSVEIAHEVRDSVMAVSDALIAQQDSLEAEAASAISEAAQASDVSATATAAALAEAREAARGLPVVQEALQRAATALRASEDARQEERATSAAVLLEAQQRNRTLSAQLLSERDASTNEIARLNTALGLAIQRGDELERAVAPSFIRRIFDMPEVALVGAAVGVVGCLSLCP